MTASDEAIEVVGALLAKAPEQGDWEWNEHCEGVALWLVPQIPTDVLARLCAERRLVETRA